MQALIYLMSLVKIWAIFVFFQFLHNFEKLFNTKNSLMLIEMPFFHFF